MLNDLRRRGSFFLLLSLPNKLDVLIEGTWLLLIFLLPVYFNPLGYQVFYFPKALLLQCGVCLLLGLYLARRFLQRHERISVDLATSLRRSPLQAAVLIFGLLWAVSTVFSVVPEASFWGSLARKNGLITMIAWIVFFLILAQCVRSRPQLYRALIVLIISAGMVCLFGILEYVDPRLLSWLSVNGRVTSTDGNPLSLSGFIAMVLPVNLAMALIVRCGPDTGLKRAIRVSGLLLVFTLQMICLCLAQYSITVLLFIPGMFLFFLLTGILLKRRATVALSTGVLILLFCLSVIIVGQTLMPRAVYTAVAPSDLDTTVAPAAPDTSVAGQTGLSTIGLRAKIWECAFKLVVDSPEVPLHQNGFHFLRRWIGYGPGMLLIAAQSRYPPSMRSGDTYYSILIDQPENHYLYLAVTIGLLGLAVFLAVVLVYYFLGLRLLRKRREKDVIYLVSAFMAGIAQYCVHILFNPTAILPELVFWLILALTVALARMEMAGNGESTAAAGNAPAITGTVEKAGGGKLRKAIAILMVIVFIGVGLTLTVRPVLADMKLSSALRTWSSNSNKTMAALAEAAQIEPSEAVYYGHIGAYALKLTAASNTAAEKSKLMALGTMAYEAAGTCEPYMAYWSYTTGDAYSYWAGHTDPGKWTDALRYYGRADILMPDNAVILNKWALALMLSGDYAEAGRKLSESRDADGEWIQTVFYTGLLDVYERCYCTAGNCFVYPVKQNTGNVGTYISFCGQLALYGGLDKVTEGLKVYAACHPDDWTGQALLGIAEVYDNRLLDAAESFRSAAQNVPSEDAAVLKGIVTRMGAETPGFQPMAQKIAESLAGKFPDSIK
jgi:tetratricopeptide (TPR) repeat protein